MYTNRIGGEAVTEFILNGVHDGLNRWFEELRDL